MLEPDDLRKFGKKTEEKTKFGISLVGSPPISSVIDGVVDHRQFCVTLLFPSVLPHYLKNHDHQEKRKSDRL